MVPSSNSSLGPEKSDKSPSIPELEPEVEVEVEEDEEEEEEEDEDEEDEEDDEDEVTSSALEVGLKVVCAAEVAEVTTEAACIAAASTGTVATALGSAITLPFWS